MLKFSFPAGFCCSYYLLVMYVLLMHFTFPVCDLLLMLLTLHAHVYCLSGEGILSFQNLCLILL